LVVACIDQYQPYFLSTCLSMLLVVGWPVLVGWVHSRSTARPGHGRGSFVQTLAASSASEKEKQRDDHVMMRKTVAARPAFDAPDVFSPLFLMKIKNMASRRGKNVIPTTTATNTAEAIATDDNEETEEEKQEKQEPTQSVK